MNYASGIKSILSQQELERTPESRSGRNAVAVSGYTADGGVRYPCSPIPVSAVIPKQTWGGGGVYLELIANVVTATGLATKCPGYFTIGECENGHRFAKVIYCGREWCPICGADKSPTHMRRFSRWIGKAQQLTTMGYLVFTIPEELRVRYRCQEALNELTKRVTAGDKSRKIEGMLKGMGFTRGLARWHWFGETPGKYHPHLNVIVEAGQLTPEQLQGIKTAYASILGVSQAVVNYSYTTEIPKMVHILKYVTRSTFKEYTWDERMAAELYNFRNMRSWGDWSGEAQWKIEGGEKMEDIAKLEKKICPCCGEPIVWGRVGEINGLAILVDAGLAEPIGQGYWRLKDI